jgi:DNA polymerase III epsilon subunit-like protein
MREPRILTVDIEVSPITAYSWGPKYETNLLHVLEPGKVMSYSAKWLGGKQVTKGLPDYTGYKPGKVDDKKIMSDLHKLLDEADIVVTQNGVSFDLKYINTRFLAHGMAPPSPYKVVDTKREAKKYLRLPSNSLDDMGQYFNLGKKEEHKGFGLWLDCIAGDEAAWRKMLSYNAQDVRLTEKVYLKILPYMRTHPNVGSFLEDTVCGKCGSGALQKRGYSRSLSTVYQRWQCSDCGGWGRSQTKEKSYRVVPNV